MAGEDRTVKDMREREKKTNRWRDDADRKRGQGKKQTEDSAKLIKNEYSFFSHQRDGSEVFKI